MYRVCGRTVAGRLGGARPPRPPQPSAADHSRNRRANAKTAPRRSAGPDRPACPHALERLPSVSRARPSGMLRLGPRAEGKTKAEAPRLPVALPSAADRRTPGAAAAAVGSGEDAGAAARGQVAVVQPGAAQDVVRGRVARFLIHRLLFGDRAPVRVGEGCGRPRGPSGIVVRHASLDQLASDFLRADQLGEGYQGMVRFSLGHAVICRSRGSTDHRDACARSHRFAHAPASEAGACVAALSPDASRDFWVWASAGGNVPARAGGDTAPRDVPAAGAALGLDLRRQHHRRQRDQHGPDIHLYQRPVRRQA